jgi:hypothetical protein
VFDFLPGDDDADFGLLGAEDAQMLDQDGADEQQQAQSNELKRSALARHANPALGVAAALLPHLRWLCACCGIPTAASQAEDEEMRQAGVSASGSTRSTPGDANSALTAISNLEAGVLRDQAPGVSMAPALQLLFRGEYTSTAAAAASASSSSSTPFSLTPLSTQASGSSASSNNSSGSSGTAVSVPGVLSILRTLIAQAKMDPVRMALMNLLQSVCQKHAGSLTPYLSALINQCLYVVRAEKLGRIKEKGIDLLGFLLMLVHAHRLDISSQKDYTPPRDIVGQMFREIGVSKSKLTQSMRGSLLSTLGLLSELCEEEFRRQPAHARELADMYGRALQDELESNREPHRKVIEGCLIGLKHFLFHFAELFRAGHQQKVLRLEGLYKAVRISLAMSDATKYDILRAGLALFSRHAALFRPFFTSSPAVAKAEGGAGPASAAAAASAATPPGETEAVLALLVQACKHPNITVSSRANHALEAFLHQVAAWLMEVRPADPSVATQPGAPSVVIPGEKRRLFTLLLSVFVKKLDGARSASEVSLAVRAMGQLAGVVLLYLGEADLRKILGRLLDASEKLFRAHTLDEVDRAVQHMPDFLAAFAFILKELRTVDASVLDYLAALLRRFLSVTQPSRSRKHLQPLIASVPVLYSLSFVCECALVCVSLRPQPRLPHLHLLPARPQLGFPDAFVRCAVRQGHLVPAPPGPHAVAGLGAHHQQASGAQRPTVFLHGPTTGERTTRLRRVLLPVPQPARRRSSTRRER